MQHITESLTTQKGSVLTFGEHRALGGRQGVKRKVCKKSQRGRKILQEWDTLQKLFFKQNIQNILLLEFN